MTRSPLVSPIVRVRVEWLSADEGGRQFPPPDGAGYGATAVFALPAGDPDNGTHFSVILDFDNPNHEYSAEAPADFIDRPSIERFLGTGRTFSVMEGSRKVADAEILEVLEENR